MFHNPECNQHFDAFITQFINEFSGLLPYAAPINVSPGSSSSESFSSSLSRPLAGCSPTFPSSPSPHTYPRSRFRGPDARSICLWASVQDSTLACGKHLSQDPKKACNHFRDVHRIHGNEKVNITCHWRDCRAAPMQRGSMIRHVLSVHLGLTRWLCQRCGKTFSRKGTSHLCIRDNEL